jgi:hypothetical protein
MCRSWNENENYIWYFGILLSVVRIHVFVGAGLEAYKSDLILILYVNLENLISYSVAGFMVSDATIILHQLKGGGKSENASYKLSCP